MKGLAVFLAAVLLCAAVPAGAVRPLTPPAPEFAPGRAWVNARPLTMQLLKGRKAVLVAFVNLASLQSLRTLPALKEWWDRYALEGLMIVGVQTPEFEFQKDPLILRRAVKRLGIQFPMVIDADRSLWKGYRVEGWPSLYLVDHKGRIVFDRLGEGSYAEFETEIREAAGRAGYKPDRTLALLEDTPLVDCGEASETIYMGSTRGKPMAIDDLMQRRGAVFINNREREAAFQGSWTVEPEALRMVKDNRGRSFQAAFVYRGAAAAALLAPGRSAQRFYVLQDERWIKPEAAGKDIHFDEDESYVEVDEPRMYDLVRNPTDDLHEVIIMPAKAGARVFELEVSDRCLAGGL
ncbi:MAG: redoxin domain-containing protein [Elusimicrobia bacterium]|nr:redoxin domain-containing protein [Elusimicrobiota bacterium]